MSIEYGISQNGLRIEAYPKGQLNIQDTIDYFNKLKNDPRIKQGAIEIVYFDQVSDFNISYEDCCNITRSYQMPKNRLVINLTIFVCETDLALGMSNMLKTLHNMTSSHQVLVVRSREELASTIKHSTH